MVRERGREGGRKGGRAYLVDDTLGVHASVGRTGATRQVTRGRGRLDEEDEGGTEGGKEGEGPVGEQEERDVSLSVEALGEGGREGGKKGW